MDIHHRISAFLDSRKAQMLHLLEQLVCIQSGSGNKPGIDRVSRTIASVMTDMGFACERIRQSDYGDHLIARFSGTDPAAKPILLVGHMDTVFPEDTAFNFFRQDHTNCYGPGVADMKGGLVVGIFAIKALWSVLKADQRPSITFVFNSDEEIGSPSSSQTIRTLARESRMGLVLEAGGLNNEIVTGRKGNLSIRLDIQGQAGHAAFAGKEKASAILELARKIITIEQLNAPEKGISANVGLIQGGIGPNTIPEQAFARMDFRFLTAPDARILESRIRSCCESTTVPGTVSTMEIISRRPPMPATSQNMRLFNQFDTIAQHLGMTVTAQLRQGVSDANLIADENIPVIDGLGPVGARDHSEDEYIQTRSLKDRSLLLAAFLAAVS